MAKFRKLLDTFIRDTFDVEAYLEKTITINKSIRFYGAIAWREEFF